MKGGENQASPANESAQRSQHDAEKEGGYATFLFVHVHLESHM